MAYKAITAKFDGKCKACGGAILAGDGIVWESLHKSTFHPECKPQAPKVVAGAAGSGTLAGLKTGKATKAKATLSGAVYHANLAAGAPGSKPMTTYTPKVQDPAPQTQKGKGIQVLQAAGILPKAMGIVCTTLEGAIAAFNHIPGEKFCRPCPITARHGFVDSRVVKDLDGLKALWAETKAADPFGELIVMPLVKASHNCVWRPGLLAIGPGHDGATAGIDSITVFLQEAYAPAWKDLAGKAGVNPETQAPFIEAVSHDGIDTVVTQIRAGVRGAPTEPDWIPKPFTVGDVIHKDGKAKADPDAMLAWEHEATTLKPGFHIVYDEGGNLADHWSVHAQLNGIAVVTTFKPHIGQELPKMGVDLIPLEPQMIIYGFLGGLLSPSLKTEDQTTRRKRTRATVAAILGTHHGLQMGGDGGVHLGASVALFLRLSQAAVWGEARHAFQYGAGGELTADIVPIKGLSRQQVFSQVLDDWLKGRKGLRSVVRCFHQGHWGGSMGGKAWAAIGHATVKLDTAMLELVKLPSRLNAKRVVAALTTAVNLAHNNVSSGCFLDKFCSGEWFDMAAGLDPRAALMAGPIWYECTLASTPDRMAILEQIEGLDPIVVGYDAPKGNVSTKYLTGKGTAGTVLKASKGVSMQDFVVQMAEQITPTGCPGGKVGGFDSVLVGSNAKDAGIPGVPVKACAKWAHDTLHAQIELSAGGYVSGEINLPAGYRHTAKLKAAMGGTVMPSMSGSSIPYTVLPIEGEPKAITLAGVPLLYI